MSHDHAYNRLTAAGSDHTGPHRHPFNTSHLVGVLAFLVGVGAGGAGKSAPTSASGPASTVTVTAPSSGGGATATVTQPGPTVTQPGPTVTVTATAAAPAAPAASADPAGPKENSEYLVNQEIAPGQWRCTDAGVLTIWQTLKKGGGYIDTGITNSGALIANITSSAYSVKFDNCNVPWVKIG